MAWPAVVGAIAALYSMLKPTPGQTGGNPNAPGRQPFTPTASPLAEAAAARVAAATRPPATGQPGPAVLPARAPTVAPGQGQFAEALRPSEHYGSIMGPDRIDGTDNPELAGRYARQAEDAAKAGGGGEGGGSNWQDYALAASELGGAFGAGNLREGRTGGTPGGRMYRPVMPTQAELYRALLAKLGRASGGY